MPLHWGVDSYNPVNHEVRVPARFRREGESGTVRESIYDYVVRRAGREPEFWGRYLNDHFPNRLRPDEPGWLRDRTEGRCRMLLVYNGIRRQPGRGSRGRDDGVSAARDAIRLADQGYDVPAGVRIYLDLEGWRVEPEFLEGWWETMYASIYAGSGGLYGRGAETRVARRSYYHDHNRPTWSAGWAGQVREAEERTAPRRMQTLLDDLQGHRASKPHSKFIWSNTPRRADLHRDTPDGTEIVPEHFGAVGPVGSMLTRTVIWQYRFGAFWADSGRHGVVDLDLALDPGYAEMWRP